MLNALFPFGLDYYRKGNAYTNYTFVKLNLYPLTSKKRNRASLVAQWLGVCLPVQRTRVRALVWEDPTCRGATGPVSHNY